MLKQYLKNLFVSIDQFANTVAGGDPDETISSRIGKRRSNCAFCRFICRLLDVVDPRHCHNSIEEDEGFDAPWRK